MLIGLLDIDSHNFPNLALMKISGWHKSQGHNVEFATMFNEYDILYKSKIFSFTPDDNYYYRAKKIINGGTGYNYNELSKEIEFVLPDYDLYNCNHAYGFLTRGCIRKCEWCIVPEKEGIIKPHMDILQIIGNKKTAILMDNNVLASKHGIKQIEKIIKLGIKVDFNQGLDARLIDNSIAKLLSKVKWLKPLRMSCDSLGMKKHIKKATELLRKFDCTPRNYFVYVLVKNINHSLNIVEFLRKLKLTPFAQPYRDFRNNKEPNKELKDFSRWVDLKVLFKTITWPEYKKNAILQKKSLTL